MAMLLITVVTSFYLGDVFKLKYVVSIQMYLSEPAVQ